MSHMDEDTPARKHKKSHYQSRTGDTLCLCSIVARQKVLLDLTSSPWSPDSGTDRPSANVRPKKFVTIDKLCGTTQSQF